MDRRLPPLSALRAFEAAARHLSAKRAAQELHVTPTAISHQVRQLEEALGAPLFLRKPRQLQLTPQGRELLAVLRESFDAIADIVERVRTRPTRRSVTLSATPAVAARLLLPWVCILRDTHPELDLRIHASHEAVALDGVTADFAIRYGSGRWPGLVAEKLLDNLMVPACHPGLKLRRRADLVHQTLLHFEPRGVSRAPGDWRTWQRLARVPGLDVSAGIVFSDETHVVAATLGGQGVALLSRDLVADELESGHLVRPFGPDLPAEPFHFVYPPARRDDPLLIAVREWVLGLPGRSCAR